MNNQTATRPELAELPRPVAFPDIRTFAELFPVLTDERQAHKWEKSEVSNWIQIKDRDGYRHAYAVLPQWLIDWVQANMLPVDYDSIYFTINARDDVSALVTAQYNQIIGSRWLALIDANSVLNTWDCCDRCGKPVGENNLLPTETSEDTGECYCQACANTETP